MKKRFLAGLALGAFFLWLALRNVPLAEVAENLGRVSPAAFALFIAMHLGCFGIRALRWSALVRHLAPIPARRLLSPLAIGFMVNFVLPARAGEVVRVWLLGRAERVSAGAAFGSVVVERLCDLFAILCLVAVTPFFLEGDAGGLLGRLRWLTPLLVVGYLAVIAALYLLGHHRAAFEAFLSRHPAVQARPLLRGAAGLAVRFAEGLGALKSPRQIVVALAYSLAIWGLAGLANLVILLAFGLHLPPFAPFLLLVLQAAGFLVPTPGALGPLQVAHRVALHDVYGVPASEALALGLIVQAGLFVAVLAPGFWFAAREHVGFRDIERASHEGSPEGPPAAG